MERGWDFLLLINLSLFPATLLRPLIHPLNKKGRVRGKDDVIRIGGIFTVDS